ncbi:hypothetical protein V8F20_006555 [Naviculisporaceae sp. PSN 640]
MDLPYRYKNSAIYQDILRGSLCCLSSNTSRCRKREAEEASRAGAKGNWAWGIPPNCQSFCGEMPGGVIGRSQLDKEGGHERAIIHGMALIRSRVVWGTSDLGRVPCFAYMAKYHHRSSPTGRLTQGECVNVCTISNSPSVFFAAPRYACSRTYGYRSIYINIYDPPCNLKRPTALLKSARRRNEAPRALQSQLGLQVQYTYCASGETASSRGWPVFSCSMASFQTGMDNVSQRGNGSKFDADMCDAGDADVGSTG